MLKTGTDKADIFFDGQYLVRIHIHKHAELEEDDMVRINEAKFSLTGDLKYTVLFIPGAEATISEEARKISASPAHNRNALAKAILVSTIHQRLIGNFFIKFYRPPVPTRVFDKEESALDWLREIGKTSGKSGS